MTATRTRSWWGWGTVEDAVAGDELADLRERVAALLPGQDLTAHDAPDPGSLDLPARRVVPPATLAGLCRDDPADRAAHAHGKAFRDVVRNLHGELEHVPDVVARPRTEQDLVDLLDWCATDGISVIPYGGGSSVVGGVEPRFDGPAVTVDLTRMDRVLEVDATSRAARIQGGVLGPHLEDQLKPHGLTLRHFPQSFEFSTLGGWLATRAGGHFATVYTHIDDLVESLRVVTPAGTSESRRLPASGAGPSPDRLFLGSEGSLGVITEAWMRLQARPDGGLRRRCTSRRTTRPWRRPGRSRSRVCIRRTAGSSTPRRPSSMREPACAGGVLVLAFESADHPVDDRLARALELCADRGGTTQAKDEATGTWRSSFLRMPYQRDALARMGMIAETFETACTWDRFESLYDAVTRRALDVIREVAGVGVVTCRFTHVYPDGPAPYFGVYAAGHWGSTVAQWDEIKAAVSETLLEHGATITHHHAVGRDHAPWYERQRPAPYAAALRAAKQALDPAGVLNPGVLAL